LFKKSNSTGGAALSPHHTPSLSKNIASPLSDKKDISITESSPSYLK